MLGPLHVLADIPPPLRLLGQSSSGTFVCKSNFRANAQCTSTFRIAQRNDKSSHSNTSPAAIIASIPSRWSNSAPDTSTACVHCGEAASKKCGRCKNARYCTIECQKADWSMHEHLCSELQKFQDRPTPNHRRVIYLKEHSNTPTFAWLPTKYTAPILAEDREDEEGKMGEKGQDTRADTEHEASEDDYERDYDTDLDMFYSDHPQKPRYGPRFSEFLGEPLPGILGLVMGARGSGDLLDHCIMTSFRDTFVYDGSQPNLCVRALTDGVASWWRGPMVVYGTPKVLDSASSIDLDTNDLTLAVNGLIVAHQKQKEGFAYFFSPKPKLPKKFTGVKIQAGRDSKGGLGDRFTFTSVKVPSQHPIFQNRNPSGISDLLGIPVQMGISSKKGSQVHAKTGDEIMPAAYLDINTIKKAGNALFGTLPPKLRDAEEVLVVDPDKRNLNKSEVEAACQYEQEIIYPLLQGVASLKDWEAALQLIDKEDWQKFRDEFEDKKLAKKLYQATVEDAEDEG